MLVTSFFFAKAMHKRMSEYYSSLLPTELVCPKPPSVGYPCVVQTKSSKEFRRGFVICQHKTLPNFYVRLVNFGGKVLKRHDELWRILPQFLRPVVRVSVHVSCVFFLNFCFLIEFVDNVRVGVFATSFALSLVVALPNVGRHRYPPPNVYFS